MQSLLVLYMTSYLLTPGHIEHIFGFAAFKFLLEHLYGPLSGRALASLQRGAATAQSPPLSLGPTSLI
jgi:hypothetical protein